MPEEDRSPEHDRLTHDQPPTIEERVESEMIALLWRNAVSGTVFHPLLIAAVYFGIEGRVSAQNLWIWLSVFAVFVIGRVIMVSAWCIRKPQGKQRLRWGWYSLATMLISVGFWGSAGPMFLHQLEPLRQALIFVLVLGAAGASVTAFSPHRPTMIVVPAVMLLPLAATSLFLGGEILAILGACTVLYYLYLLRAGLEHYRSQAEAQRLRFERAALVDDLRAARDASEEANRAKSEFLANMSHELRTPLNAILGFSEMMQLGIFANNVPDRFREYAELIHRSGQHLLELIGDLLDLSKAEAGALELDEEEFDLAETVTASIELLVAVAAKSDIALSGPDETGKAILVRADARKLRQILFNLISNSIKFTPAGGEVKVAVHEPPEGGIKITVSDSGIGMTREQVEMALKPFVQVDHGDGKSYPGTGLGLPLAKTLTELHGGHFRVESTLGVGTTMHVHLPAARNLLVSERKSA